LSFQSGFVCMCYIRMFCKFHGWSLFWITTVVHDKWPILIGNYYCVLWAQLNITVSCIYVHTDGVDVINVLQLKCNVNKVKYNVI